MHHYGKDAGRDGTKHPGSDPGAPANPPRVRRGGAPAYQLGQGNRCPARRITTRVFTAKMPLDVPPDENESSGATTLWRYMDLPGVVSILSTGTLWFAKAVTLRDDPWEGFGQAK